MSENTKIGIFSFFAGAGFLDLGFETTGNFNTLFVNEYHQPFMDIYVSSREDMGIDKPQFGHHVNDISDFLTGEKKEALSESLSVAKMTNDFVGFIGGPPCPDFSVGGKNKGIKGENGKLSGTYIELIIKNKPDFFLFENVKGLYRTKKHRDFFDSIKLKLIQNGYSITEKLINAIEYGVPQDRERIILIGFKNSTLFDFGVSYDDSKLDHFDWSKKIKYNAKDVFSLNWPAQEVFIEDSVKNQPKGIIEDLTVEHWFKKNDIKNHPNATHHFQPRAGLPKFQSIEEGDDLKKSYKRLHRWRYSPTAAYGNNEVHLHPYKARRISVAEALSIQSLPKEFIIPEHISLSNMFKTIGNGVPYLAGKGLANAISNFVHQLQLKQVFNEKIIS